MSAASGRVLLRSRVGTGVLGEGEGERQTPAGRQRAWVTRQECKGDMHFEAGWGQERNGGGGGEKREQSMKFTLFVLKGPSGLSQRGAGLKATPGSPLLF